MIITRFRKRLIFTKLFISLLVVGGCSIPSTEVALPSITIADNGRFFKTEKGDPFFWFGDTNWVLFHRTTLDDADIYFKDRIAKGFNVIQAGICGAGIMEGVTNPSHNIVNGQLPFEIVDSIPDPTKPNELFFKHVDQMIDKAAAYGLYIALLPTWAEFVCPAWHNGPKIFDVQSARSYGAWLAKRYGNRSNIIWVNGGDRAPDECNASDLDIWRALAEGIRSQDPDHIMTYHPKGNKSSDEWFHNAEWMDFNMYQSIRWPENIVKLTEHAYQQVPAKPVVNGEPFYYANRWIQEVFDDKIFRSQPYWSFIAGARGYTFGMHHVWFFDKNDEHLNFEKNTGIYWHEKLDGNGTRWAVRFADIMKRLNWWEMEPDSTLILDGRGEGLTETVACRLPDSSNIMIYFPNNSTATLDLNRLGKDEVQLTWYKTDEELEIKQTINIQGNVLAPPKDWEDGLLIIQ